MDHACMSFRINITSVVSKPDIVTISGKLECRGKFWSVVNPSISEGNQTMLHENNWLFGSCFDLVIHDSKNSKDISIFGGDLMLFKAKTSSFGYLLECFVKIGWHSFWLITTSSFGLGIPWPVP
jgi:hypothetical protein